MLFVYVEIDSFDSPGEETLGDVGRKGRRETYRHRKHLVNMSVDSHTLPVWGIHELSPEAQRLEGIMDQYNRIALLRCSKGKAIKSHASVDKIISRL